MCEESSILQEDMDTASTDVTLRRRCTIGHALSILSLSEREPTMEARVKLQHAPRADVHIGRTEAILPGQDVSSGRDALDKDALQFERRALPLARARPRRYHTSGPGILLVRII
jgi:hypothetical protein